MEFYSVKNPSGSVLQFISSYSDSDEYSREKRLIDWMKNQSPGLEEHKLNEIFLELNNRFNFDLNFIEELFIKLGWQTHWVKPLLAEKFELAKSHGFIETMNGNVSLSELGEYILKVGKYQEYLHSMPYKAEFWKRNNVKITDNKEIGSGSFIDRRTIVTCKHVIDELDQNKLIIEDESGNRYNIDSIIRHPSPEIDLAKIKTVEDFDFFTYMIDEQTNILDQVIIFGYPPIPLASEPFLIVNLGEVSSIVDNYLDKTDCLILSSITRPGNSGGPVINQYGNVVGIIIQNRQHKLSITWKDFKNLDLNKGLGYATALQAKYIMEF